MEKNFESTKKFLKNYFPNLFKPLKHSHVVVNMNSNSSSYSNSKNFVISTLFFDKIYPEIDEMNDRELITEFVSIRKSITLGSKFLYRYSDNSSYNSSSNNSSFHLKKYNSVTHSLNLKIQELKYISLYILYLKYKRSGYREIDLHYLHLDEAEQLVHLLIQELQVNF